VLLHQCQVLSSRLGPLEVRQVLAQKAQKVLAKAQAQKAQVSKT
jgi:hypothetical protein